MLILTRKRGEAIRIGDKIRIVVTRIDNNQVRIGIEGPSDVSILREEIYATVVEGNCAAQHIDIEQLSRLIDITPDTPK